ncbi:MAG: HAD-IA family hydrolase [Lachnospiraceae bacterium]|nr:HAD-IA family hydrolase [Lachnospiraceae bacterium]
MQKAVVFDMDGVLFDTERLFMEAGTQLVKESGIENAEEAVMGCIGLNMRDTKALFLRVCGEDFPFEEYHKKCGALVKEKIEKEGLPLKKGVRELLSYLKEAGYKIALASSTSQSGVFKHLEMAGLREYFAVVIGGDMIEHGKPEPDIYLRACEELGVKSDAAFAIEDSANGIRSAYKAGLHTIMVPDLIAPTPELEALLYARYDSLLDVRDMLMIKDGVLKEPVRIPLEGICNTRDLGGYKSKDGRTIKPHKLIRSGALACTTEADRQVLLADYQLKTVIDFRTGSERNMKPDPDLEGITYIGHPILEEETMGITREKEACGSRDMIGNVISTLRENGGTPLGYMQNMYQNLITNPFSRKRYAEFFDILLAQEEGAVLWHCTAGKDRVGVATLLLLATLDISKEQIILDYIKVNEFGKEEVDGLMQRVTGGMDTSTKEAQETIAAIRLLFTVDRSYAESVFAVMEEECGSIEAFLEQKMGLTPEKRALLKEKYLM